MEFVSKNLPTKETQGPNGFTGDSSKHLRKKSYQFDRVFQKIKEEGILLNSLYKEVIIFLIPKPNQ